MKKLKYAELAFYIYVRSIPKGVFHLLHKILLEGQTKETNKPHTRELKRKFNIKDVEEKLSPLRYYFTFPFWYRSKKISADKSCTFSLVPKETEVCILNPPTPWIAFGDVQSQKNTLQTLKPITYIGSLTCIPNDYFATFVFIEILCW